MNVSQPSGVSSVSPPGRIALIGAGAFGRFCVEAYGRTLDLEVVAVADASVAALQQVHAPGALLITDWRAAIEDSTVEVLHLATPPHLRRDIVLAALEAGKSVFCEKPLALSIHDADEMIRASETSGTALGVNYVMRFQPAYRILESLAGSGLMGKLRSISFQNFAQRLSPDHWFWDRNQSGGIFVEHGVHFFDAYARIAGRATRATGSIPRPEAVDATVEYETDVIGRFYHEFAFPKQVERTVGTSFFEHGWIEIDGWIPTRLTGAVIGTRGNLEAAAFAPYSFQIQERDGVSHFSIDFPDRDRRYEAGIVAGIREIVRKHRNPRASLTVSTADARDSLAVGLTCQEAAVTRAAQEVLLRQHGGK